MITYEQQARDIIERCGVQDAQQKSASDVVEVANLLVEIERLRILWGTAVSEEGTAWADGIVEIAEAARKDGE